MTIDRAIEILDPEHRECYDGMDEVNEACRMGMEALERTRWVPCSERLPENGVPVFINYIGSNDGKYHPDATAVWTDHGCFWWEGSLEDCDTEVAVPITHWQPLPEPPEEGGAGNAAD